MSRQWPLTDSILVFVGMAIVTAVAGTRLVRSLDERSRQSHKRSARDNVAIGAALVDTVLTSPGVIVARSAVLETRPYRAGGTECPLPTGSIGMTRKRKRVDASR